MSSNKRPRTKPTQSAAQKQAEYKRRRTKDQDYSKHAFLDASATVHAGLFSARRLPEIKSLWRGLVDDEINSRGGDVRRVGQSGGGKISSRHLRRRTGSHRPRRRHRFPKGDHMTADGSNLKSDAGETDDTVSEGHADQKPNQDVQKPKRVTKSKPLCRRARRKPALLKAAHSTWWDSSLLYPNPTPKTRAHKWLPTHYWHAKRFHIASLFGWSVPLVHCNRGSRAALRLASEKCTVQDATWEVDGCALVLRVQRSQNCDKKSLMLGLVGLLQRLCGADSTFLRDEDVLRGNEMGEGLIYEVDSFPMNLIGPASFLFEEDGDAASVSIMVHPSFRLKVMSLLESIILDSDGLDGTISSKPLALLRIRGATSLPTLVESLSIEREILIESCTSQDDVKEDSDEVLSHCSLVHCNAPSSFTNDTLLLESTSTKMDTFNSGSKVNEILIKSHQPNVHLHEKQPSNNTACSGFDILCHPSIAINLFQSLVLNGACSIGLTEDARIQLESSPPLPVFPRDYPDTEEGKNYWEGLHSNDVPKNSTSQDWAVIRTCLEAPWGRMNTSLKKVLQNHCQSKNVEYDPSSEDDESGKVQDESIEPSDRLVSSIETPGQKAATIQWGCLVPTSQNQTGSVIVVRGSFGDPFLSILNSYGKFKSSHSLNTTKHKKRRRHKAIIKASPLSKEEFEAHFNVCQNLLNALSLPAVLKCEIYCDGKGTLETGDLLFPLYDSSDDSDGEDSLEKYDGIIPLGVVTAGGFSPSRGTCHGIGFVGASRFIEALMNSSVDGMGMKLDGSTKMMLKVHLRKLSPDCTDRYALISLLL